LPQGSTLYRLLEIFMSTNFSVKNSEIVEDIFKFIPTLKTSACTNGRAGGAIIEGFYGVWVSRSDPNEVVSSSNSSSSQY